MYCPSGEICAPAISGLPKNSSRSMTGGGVSAAPARAPAPRHSRRTAGHAYRSGHSRRSLLMSSGTGSGRPVARPAGRIGRVRKGRCKGSTPAREVQRKWPRRSRLPPDRGQRGFRPDTFAAVVRRRGDGPPQRRGFGRRSTGAREFRCARTAAPRLRPRGVALNPARRARGVARRLLRAPRRGTGSRSTPSSRASRSRPSPPRSPIRFRARHERGPVKYAWEGRIRRVSDGASSSP